MEGDPVLVVRNGEIVEQALNASSLSRRELLMKLRMQSVRNLGEIECAFFEPSGQVSVFRASSDRQRDTISTQPRETKTS